MTNDTNIKIKFILSLLSIIIITCAISLAFENNNIEGLSGGEITNEIDSKWNNFKNHMDRFGVILGEDFEKIFKSIGKNIENGFLFFGENIRIMGNYFECGMTRLENFPDCVIFYIIDIICDLIYTIVYIIFAIIGQTWILDQSIDFFKKLDCSLYDVMGFHIFQYPQTVLDHCYLCPKIVNSENGYNGFVQPPPSDNPDLENPFDELANAFS